MERFPNGEDPYPRRKGSLINYVAHHSPEQLIMQKSTSGLLTKARNCITSQLPNLPFQLTNILFVDKFTASPHLNHTIVWFNLNHSIIPLYMDLILVL